MADQCAFSGLFWADSSICSTLPGCQGMAGLGGSQLGGLLSVPQGVPSFSVLAWAHPHGSWLPKERAEVLQEAGLKAGPAASLPPPSSDQIQPLQPRFKGWDNLLHLLMGRAVQSHGKRGGFAGRRDHEDHFAVSLQRPEFFRLTGCSTKTKTH